MSGLAFAYKSFTHRDLPNIGWDLEKDDLDRQTGATQGIHPS